MFDFSRFEMKVAQHVDLPAVQGTDASITPPAKRRGVGMAIVFLKLYGGRDSVVTRKLGLSPEDCDVALGKFKSAFPGLRKSS
jgi:hypothetical protein